MQQVIGLLSLGGTDLLAAIVDKAADNPALDIGLPAAAREAERSAPRRRAAAPPG